MKMRATTGLGATYALFTALNEYFHEWGYLDDKGYEYHKQKYGRPLVDEFEHQLKMRDGATRMKIRQKQLEIEQLTKQLANVCEQWPTMKAEARKYYLNLAKEHSDLPIAKQILQKVSWKSAK